MFINGLGGLYMPGVTGVPVGDFLRRQGLDQYATITEEDLNRSAFKSYRNYSGEDRKMKRQDRKLRNLIQQYFNEIDHVEKYSSREGTEAAKLGQIGPEVLQKIAGLDGNKE